MKINEKINKIEQMILEARSSMVDFMLKNSNEWGKVCSKTRKILDDASMSIFHIEENHKPTTEQKKHLSKLDDKIEYYQYFIQKFEYIDKDDVAMFGQWDGDPMWIKIPGVE